MTSGFGRKWKEFFLYLELHHHLDRNNDAHLWLVHHIFLPYINNDASTWAATWNEHTLSSRTESYASPHQKYIHGMLEKGCRALFPQSAQIPAEDPDQLGEDAITAYGVDWEDMEQNHIMQHHAEHHQHHQNVIDNPFISNLPDRLSHVSSEDPRCPFEAATVDELNTYLSQLPYLSRCNISDCNALTQLWIDALVYATNLCNTN